MTIIELVIVIMVTSILAAAAMPTFIDSLLYHRVESAARRVKADLELARQTARLNSAAQSISFTNGTYILNGVADLDAPNEDYFVDLSAAPFEISRVIADFGGASTVSFDGYGTPTSGGSVVLIAKGYRSTVSLNATTGGITIATGRGN